MAMKKNIFKWKRLRSAVFAAAGMFIAAGAFFMAAPQKAEASDSGYWVNENGASYWYENGVKQGLEGRGKEIYDPESDAWYWLDAVQNGAKAVSKDVYQESNGGKWVRYDANGHMVKGEDYKDGAWYYFDTITGAMYKGHQNILTADGLSKWVYYDDISCRMRYGEFEINGIAYCFDAVTGAGYDNGWLMVGEKEYWYEKGVRQGYNGNDAFYRGKEIYDPRADAWFWLDNVQAGAKAKGKDVYQESDGGKWVRYDSEGRMEKGWQVGNDGWQYYFDLVTGAMAKGEAIIDGASYYFDEETGRQNINFEPACYHLWKEADCTTPNICILCGATYGYPKGHNWTDATCVQPKMCISCGIYEGSKAEHTWKEATCIRPKECSVCGLTEGSTGLGHEYEYVVIKQPTKTEEGLGQYVCTRCGESTAAEAIPELGEETPWVYNSDRTHREKTMYDGTVICQDKYTYGGVTQWGRFDDEAAEAMTLAVNEMIANTEGWTPFVVEKEGQFNNYQLAKYNAFFRLYFISHNMAPCDSFYQCTVSGAVPDVENDKKYITLSDGAGMVGGNYIACFIFGGGDDIADDYVYGKYWRSCFGVTYASKI